MKEEGAALDGRIVLKGLLGAGGMGEVHRAWDRALERAVAVKFFKGAGPRESERLLLEGRLQARVDHPHVVRVFDAGTLEGRACLVLQLVEGRSLAELAPSLSLDARVELVRQAALGVRAAHLQGLVLRDVKPGNLLVEQGPGELRALVSDFGLARGEEPGLTRSGIAPGTLAFISGDGEEPRLTLRERRVLCRRSGPRPAGRAGECAPRHAPGTGARLAAAQPRLRPSDGGRGGGAPLVSRLDDVEGAARRLRGAGGGPARRARRVDGGRAADGVPLAAARPAPGARQGARPGRGAAAPGSARRRPGELRPGQGA